MNTKYHKKKKQINKLEFYLIKSFKNLNIIQLGIIYLIIQIQISQQLITMEIEIVGIV